MEKENKITRRDLIRTAGLGGLGLLLYGCGSSGGGSIGTSENKEEPVNPILDFENSINYLANLFGTTPLNKKSVNVNGVDYDVSDVVKTGTKSNNGYLAIFKNGKIPETLKRYFNENDFLLSKDLIVYVVELGTNNNKGALSNLKGNLETLILNGKVGRDGELLLRTRGSPSGARRPPEDLDILMVMKKKT